MMFGPAEDAFSTIRYLRGVFYWEKIEQSILPMVLQRDIGVFYLEDATENGIATGTYCDKWNLILAQDEKL